MNNEKQSPARPERKGGKWLALSICLFFVAAACIIVGILGVSGMFYDISPEGNHGAHIEGTDFSFYTGPVMPLSASGDIDNLIADRSIAFDFTNFKSDSLQGSSNISTAVTDTYIITNTSGKDADVQLIYPFTDSFASELADTTAVPQISVEGAVMDTDIRIGGYSGGLTDDGMNLQNAGNWEEYKNLLSDTSYISSALTENMISDEPVTVYFLEDITVPASSNTQASTIAMKFTLDPAKSQVITYGISGYSGDGKSNEYSFFTNEYTPDLRCIIVIGDPISKYELKGYSDGSCTQELSGLTCEIRVSESTLSETLQACIEDYLKTNVPDAASAGNTPNTNTVNNISKAAYYFYLSYASGESVMLRYSPWCRLDDIISDAFGAGRVMYVTCDAVIPAGKSITVVSDFIKHPSHDYYTQGRSAAVYGFDMAVSLGTRLSFSKQTAGIVLPADVKIVSQNFGFDVAAGITTIELTGEHYYLEVVNS